MSYGTAASNRVLVAAVGMGGGSSIGVDGVEIDGVAMTLATGSKLSTAGGGNHLAIHTLPLSSGTSGTVTVQVSVLTGNIVIALYPVYGISTSVYDVETSLSSSPSLPLDVKSGGFFTSLAYADGGATATWTNITEKFDTNVEATFFSSGAADIASATEGQRAISTTAGGSVPVAVAISFSAG
jgi:hypothetical protein